MIEEDDTKTWYAGAIGRIPDDDSLVYQGDAVTGKQFYAGSLSEACDAAIILNTLTTNSNKAVQMLRDILNFIQGGLPKPDGRGEYDLPADAANYLCQNIQRMQDIVDKADEK